jgi:2,4-dienoyl-CoA reductase (NADPH2)
MIPSTAIFTSLNMGSLRFKNRLVSLPIYTGYAHPDGRVSNLLIEHYRNLAESGVALVTVANAAVSSDGVVAKHNLRVDHDEFIPGLERLAKVIRQAGALACLQLNHGGRFAATEQPVLPFPIDGSNLAFNVASLKNFMTFFPLEKRFGLTRSFISQTGKWRRGMTVADTGRVIDDFGEAAARAYRAGFDMIEIHGANGYLICQLLSAFTNRGKTAVIRKLQHRAAIPLAVIREIKQRLPVDFPVGFRLLLREWVPDGIDLPEAIQLAVLLQQERVAYLSTSVGTYNSIFSSEALQHMGRTAYLEPDMRRLKQAVEMPTIISGRIIEPQVAEALVSSGAADLIGLGRPLRVDIKWVEKARSGSEAIRRCSNCNGCLKQVIMDRGFACVRWPQRQRERIHLEHRLLSRSYKSLWVLSGSEDPALFRAGMPHVLPESQRLAASIPAKICFLERSSQQHVSEFDQNRFLAWCSARFHSMAFQTQRLSDVSGDESGGFHRVIRTEIEQGRYGMVFMGRDARQAWQERILSRVRGKIMVLLGKNPLYRKVLVPVDLSETALLVLSLLHRFYAGEQGVDFRFVHVLRGPPGSVEKRWRELVEIAGLSGMPPLDILQSNDAVPEEILKVVKQGKFGMVVMGKRGLSGIKRWMLGSVSMGVLKGLSDQTIMLID